MVKNSLRSCKHLCANVVFEKPVAYLGRAPENLGFFKKSIIELTFERQYFAKGYGSSVFFMTPCFSSLILQWTQARICNRADKTWLLAGCLGGSVG